MLLAMRREGRGNSGDIQDWFVVMDMIAIIIIIITIIILIIIVQTKIKIHNYDNNNDNNNSNNRWSLYKTYLCLQAAIAAA